MQKASFSLRFCLVLVLAIAGANSVTASDTRQMQILNPAQNDGIKLLDRSSPDFAATIAPIVNSAAAGRLADVLPYAVVLVNESRQPVWSFTIVFQYPELLSPSGAPWRLFFTRGAQRGGDPRTMLPPGGAYLITPADGIEGAIDGSGQVITPLDTGEEMDRSIGSFKEGLGAKARVRAVLDSVIFADGFLVGPDTLKQLEDVNARIRAESDIVASVRTLHGADLKRQLKVYAPSQRVGPCANHLCETADWITTVLDHWGDDAAQRLLNETLRERWFTGSAFVRRKYQ